MRMRQFLRSDVVLAVGLAGAALAVLASRGALGDYSVDAGPAIGALIRGHVGYALAHQPLMGSLAVLARLPFAFAAKALGAGALGEYRAGVLPCVAALAVLGGFLVRLRPAAPAATVVLVPALAVLTPASLAAVKLGHPEEALCAALAVAAVLYAGRRAVVGGLLLGLAVATKQWAVLAIAPALLAAVEGTRLKLLGTALAVAAVFTVPLAIAEPSSFFSGAHAAAGSTAASGRDTLWFLVAHPVHFALHLGPGLPTSGTIYELPAWVPTASHPLILLASPLLALLAWRRRRARAGDPLALLALIFLVRCLLDPADNTYYHLPMLTALLAYETVGLRNRRMLPMMTAFACAGLWSTSTLDLHGAAAPLTNAVYLCWTGVTAVYLVHALGLLRVRRSAVPVFAELARQHV